MGDFLVRRSLTKESLLTLVHAFDRYESGRSPQWFSGRFLFLSPRQASVRVELGRSAGPEHLQFQ